MADTYDLERFVAAQSDVYPSALSEIRRGAKRSHWMWFVFSQIRGLGHSEMSRRYSIVSLDEARAYLGHTPLGPRLRESVIALQDLKGTTAGHVFGDVDAAKLRSSLTLFEAVAHDPLFSAALDRWFSGERDQRTLDVLASSGTLTP